MESATAQNDEEEDSVGDQLRSILKNYGIENMTIDIETQRNSDSNEFPEASASKQ